MRRELLRLLAVAVTLETACVALLARHGDFLQRGEGRLFVIFGVTAGLCFFAAVGCFTRIPMSARQSTAWLWTVAVVLRLAILPVTPGDDLWRYRWEGRIQSQGHNPYVLAPNAPVLASLRDAEWEKINHRDFPAVYPPLAEMSFAALAAVKMPVAGYRVIFALCDLGVVALVCRLLVRSGQSLDAAAWYAWNPLVVYASAGAAHFDILAVCALVGAVLLLDNFSTPAPGIDKNSWHASPAAWMSVLLLGAAISLKAVPAVLLPVWAFALGWRRALLLLPVAVALPLVLALPYGFPAVPVFAALRTFASGFHVNDAVWWAVDLLVPTAQIAAANRLYPTLALLVCTGVAIRLRTDWRRTVLWVIGAALLLAPALHAWYLLWVLPLAAWRGTAARPWMVLSVSMFGYFLLWEVNHASGQPWEEPLWLRALVYLPPLLALGWHFLPRLRTGRKGVILQAPNA